MSRLWREQRKLEAKLGEDDERPKRDAFANYERIVPRLNEVMDRKDQAFMVVALPFPRRYGMGLEERGLVVLSSKRTGGSR